jgi:3-carboxy-cis,cis-muconate cycloisomerase
MALAAHLGRPDAQQIVKAAAARVADAGVTFRQALLEDARVGAVLSPAAIDGALDPAGYLGSADALIDRALASYQAFARGS